MWFQKNWYHILTLKFFWELFRYCHNFQLLFSNFSRKKDTEKNLQYGKLPLILQYLLTRILLLTRMLLYSAADLFPFFNKSNGVFYWNGLSICVFTEPMNNSTQLKDREMKLLVLLLLIILEMRSSAALKCATCVCFLSKLWVLKKIYSKFVEPWEMKKLPWDRETIWHKVKLWELREICKIVVKKYFWNVPN